MDDLTWTEPLKYMNYKSVKQENWNEVHNDGKATKVNQLKVNVKQ